MKKIISVILIGMFLLLVSCSFEQDPLASFPKEIREAILPEDNRVLKPIPRGAIKVESLPVSPLLFHNEESNISISVRLLQNFQAPFTVDILNLDTLPGEASFDSKTNKISWTPNLDKLQGLFAYIPIDIRVNFKEPKSLYVEHTIYARAYRKLRGLKVLDTQVTKFVAGAKSARVTITVKDLDADLSVSGQKSGPPRWMITQGNKSKASYLLPYLEALDRPRLKNWKDQSTWMLVARFNLKNLKLKKGKIFYLNHQIFSSFGKTSGVRTKDIFIETNIVLPKPPKKDKDKPEEVKKEIGKAGDKVKKKLNKEGK